MAGKKGQNTNCTKKKTVEANAGALFLEEDCAKSLLGLLLTRSTVMAFYYVGAMSSQRLYVAFRVGFTSFAGFAGFADFDGLAGLAGLVGHAGFAGVAGRAGFAGLIVLAGGLPRPKRIPLGLQLGSAR